ncbi:MAG: hypothetical protein JWN90_18 [Parcubacteria group bacterium]|nr:hypothetical protein [Parcubacteria group bacterium]
MTNSPLKIIVAIVALVIIVAGVYFVFFSPKAPTQIPSDGTSFPIASTTPGATAGSPTMSVAGKDGRVVTVNNFVNAPGTVAEPYTQGEYVVADDCANNDGCTKASNGTGFRVVYDERNQSFNVLLLAEPLKDSRKNAQQFLMQSLGIKAASLCSLNATVGTIQAVNGTYAGEELGFNGCPGAVVLP